MTETARLADYVLPATTQYEKFEASFFNFEFPRNVFHLRRPVLEPPAGPLDEPEIHSRILEAAGLLTPDVVAPLRSAAEQGRAAFAAGVRRRHGSDAALGAVAPVLLYRTLGPTPPARRRVGGRALGRSRSGARCSTRPASRAPGSAPDPTRPSACSTPSSTARPVS